MSIHSPFAQPKLVSPHAIEPSKAAPSKATSLPTPSKNAAHPLTSLPPVPTSYSEWSKFRESASLKPYQEELSGHIAKAHDFLIKHAASGRGRQRAIEGLALFRVGKVECEAKQLSQTTFGQNRIRFEQVNRLLQDENIPLAQRSAVAVELFGALGVCPQGEAIHFENALAELQPKHKGFEANLQQAKEALIDQVLLALVKQTNEDTKYARAMEIHHVQGLKNAVSRQWNIPTFDDQNIEPGYQQTYTPVAQAVLSEAISAKAISSVCAEKIHGLLCEQLGESAQPDQWHPTHMETIGGLESILKVEMGEHIRLNDVLELNDEGTFMKVKSQTSIALVIEQKGKSLGAISGAASRATHSEKPLAQIISDSLKHKDPTPAIKRQILRSSSIGMLSLLIAQATQDPDSPAKHKKDTPTS